MDAKVKRKSPAVVQLDARPEAVEIDLARTALVIVDMQHAFVSEGAYIDLKGYDIGPSREIIESIRRLIDAARQKGCKIIYFYTTHHSGDDGGGPDSVHWHKEASMAFLRENPQYKDKMLLPNTWEWDIRRKISL